MENIRIKGSSETVSEFLVQLSLTFVQMSNARGSLLKNKIITAWIPVLKKWVSIESTVYEQMFCCICQLMLGIENTELIAEPFVQEFINCGGPDATVEMLHTLMESKRGGLVVGAFCLLLPLCKMQCGQKWLRKNYHKIVECYQLFDSTTGLLDFPLTTVNKVRAIWQHFKETFETIQATESKKHEAELLADEEREKAKRERKNERKKRRDQKKGLKGRGDNLSPNTSVEDDGGDEEVGCPTTTPYDEERNCRKIEQKKDEFEVVLSKKELKINKKKAQSPEQDGNEKIEGTVVKVMPPRKEDDEIFMNFRPNRGKLPGQKNKALSKVKPSDLPWRNLNKPVGNTSPGKEFPKLCKEKFASLMKEVHEKNEMMFERKGKLTNADSEDNQKPESDRYSDKTPSSNRNCKISVVSVLKNNSDIVKKSEELVKSEARKIEEEAADTGDNDYFHKNIWFLDHCY